jgi:site-specific DNA recombinase
MTEAAVLYARKSDPNARENDPAFEQQEQACREYAAKHGYVVIDAIREAYTGADLPHQDGLWGAIDQVKHGRAQVVISYSYDRLSRDTRSQEVVLYEIEDKYGGRFEAVTEPVPPDDGTGTREIVRAALGSASKVEKRRVVERLARGKRDRATRHALSGTSNAKYGYRFMDEGPKQHTTYVPEEVTAATVRCIYEWADQGVSMQSIARRLNAEGTPTPGRWASEHGIPHFD